MPPKKPVCGHPCVSTNKPCKKTVKAEGQLCHLHQVVETCSICHEDMDKRKGNEEAGAVETECGHAFHKACLQKWAQIQPAGKKSCPMCRAQLGEEYQWPKYVVGMVYSWEIKDLENARRFIDYIDKDAESVARYASAAQVIFAKVLKGGGGDQDIVTVSIPGFKINNLRRAVEYTFNMNKSTFIIPLYFDFLDTFDLLLELRALKAMLQAILQPLP